MANKGGSDLSGYKYAAMSNLVLQADKRFTTRRQDEVTGDPESLAGRINIGDMGSRNAREKAPTEKKKPKGPSDIQRGTITEGENILEREQKRRRRGEPSQLGGAGLLSQVDLQIEDLRYKPRTPATRATYELITTIVGRALGDVPSEVTRSAADAVLEYLKDEDLKDFDRKKEIDDLLGTSMGPKEFNELVNLGKKITDYNAQDDEDEEVEEAAAGDGDDAEGKQGVAVVFDEEDDDEDAGQTFEVRDEDETDEEDDQFAERNGAEDAAAAGGAPIDSTEDGDMGDDEELIINTGAAEASGDKKETDAIIPAHEIDAFWLQRQIGQVYPDPHTQQDKTQKALDIMGGIGEDDEYKPLREIENDLMELFDYEYHELVAKFVLNKDKIVWVTRWRQVADDKNSRAAVEREMIAAGHRRILNELRTRETGAADNDAPGPKKMKFDLMDIDVSSEQKDTTMADAPKDGGLVGGLQPKRLIALENLVFDQGNHLMTNPTVKLPQGSTKKSMKGYEEISVPAPQAKRAANEPKPKPTSELPDWAQVGFGKNKELNRIQTKCYPAAFEDDGNMLICAPTGSGKTNVAMLTMLREIGKHRDPRTGEIALDDFKIIYIAPLKALVSEQVGNFGARLAPYGVKVAELTGDRQLTKQQIAETQVIVTTPEKYDVITRKATDTSYINLVRLICIDEIHLLHDERGPVLESIVSRTIRRTEQTGENVRLIGLSATLPNYRDVASFLRVDPQQGLFHFDGTYRPCPLKQNFIGVTDKKAIKQLNTMNDVCYNKVLEHQSGQTKQQMLIFVHSRKETAKTAKYIRDKALDAETIGQIGRQDAATREILREESDSIQNADLKDVMPYGIGIHHAGMSRADRSTVEDLFSDGSLQVLVCTATLAWGVNLPAHTVIIKGTQVYSPEKGSWVELSPQDVLQMLGRAGRPQYDTYGEGIIITTQAELQYYLSLLNQQLPIESQFMSKLADNLNAEIVLGNVRTRDEGVEWLGYTYLFVRMLRSPGLYSVGADYEDDDALEQKRVDLIHSAASVLEKCNLLKYEKRTGKFTSTELGRISSHYYISHNSMATYNLHIQPGISSIELFRIFALSEEFKYIPIRQDEKLELAKLLARVPIPVKEGVEEPQAKINVLLQAYISRLQLEGLALMADLVYVTQSAGRILRAIFEICLKKGWADVAKLALDLCKSAEKRMWPTMTPLRQFNAPNASCPKDIIAKAERIDVPFKAYFDLEPPQMGELLGLPKAGRLVCNLVAKFPRLEITTQVHPITRSILRVELTIRPNFEWDDNLHGAAEAFWIVVEDCNGEEILFHDQFLLRKAYAQADMNEHLVEFTVPIREPMDPVYFVSVISDRWMNSEARMAVPLMSLILPDKFPPHTPVLDLQPLMASALKIKEYQALYEDLGRFNKIQTQVFTSLYTTDDNAFIGASTGMGKTICAEFAILRHWSKGEEGSIVYLAPFQELVDNQFKNWKDRLSSIGGGKDIVKLTGELSADIRLLERGDLVLATPTQWDLISRQWQRRKTVQTVALLVADDLHMVGGLGGQIYETVVSRMHAMSNQVESGLRIVGLSVSLANARDIGEWIGATKHTIFNFSPHVRSVPLELHIQSFTIPHFPSLMLAMVRPVYLAITQLSPDKPAMVFVPNRKQVRSTALDLLAACVTDDNEDRFLNAAVEEFEPILEKINERALEESLRHGIGYFHEALNAFDKRAVQHLYNVGAIQVLLVSRDSCWEINANAHLVIVMGTQFYEGREHRYIDYPISEILQMFGKAGRVGEDKVARGVLMVPAVKRDYYKKFLNEALPIESHLQSSLADAFVAEICSKVIESTQDAVDWSTYTYFYRRLLANPSYYGLRNRTQEALNSYLSDLVEETLKELIEGKIIEVDDEDDSIIPMNSAMIAAHYNVSYISMQTFLLSLNAKTKLRALLEIVTAATEFDTLPIRRHEDKILRRIYDRVPVKAEESYETPSFKAFVLLQAHFSRTELPIDLAKDQEIILRKVISLLSAAVDVLSSDGHINAMTAMELSQMVVQAMWNNDSPLKQIPHFDNDKVKIAQKFGVDDVDAFMNAMDLDEFEDHKEFVAKLGLDNRQLGDAARFTNEYYPDLDLQFELINPDEIMANQPSFMNVVITRNIEEDDEPKTDVHAPFYPGDKTENWWLVVGDEKTGSLLGIKRVTPGRQLKTKLQFTVPEPGEHNLSLHLVCDSYRGADHVLEFEVRAAEGMDEDDDEEEEDDEE